jgi:uncharacterized cupredoxin-like copper-binding protein
VRVVTRLTLAAALGATVVGIGYAADAAGGSDTDRAVGPGLVTAEVDIEHSLFARDTIHVQPGTTVRFVIRNGDPIAHEFVVGDAAVHRRHQNGSEAVHPPVPGEVSVRPGETGLTFYEFDRPGAYEFACHLPGHYAYGMRGTVFVEPA